MAYTHAHTENYIHIYNFQIVELCFVFDFFVIPLMESLFNLISPLFLPYNYILGNGHLFKYITFKRSF